MSIAIHCPNCDSRFKADERHAGRQAKCPGCSQPLKIPRIKQTTPSKSAVGEQVKKSTATTEGSPAKSPQDNKKAAKSISAEQLLASFQGSIKRTRPSIGYRLGSLVVAIVMILLPVIYILTIVGAGYAVYYHTVNHTTILQTQVRGRGYIFLILAYLSPIVCGIILVAFMIKPLFFRAAHDTRTRSLRRESEPLLFAFVDKICTLVGAAPPKRIDLDCQINASASFR